MANDPSVPKQVTLWEDTGLITMARVLGQLGTPVTIPTISSVRCEVMNALTEAQIAVLTVDPADVFFNDLQDNDERWTADSIGYNFLHVVPASAFPEPHKTYRLGYLFTPVSGEPIPLAFDVRTKRLFGNP